MNIDNVAENSWSERLMRALMAWICALLLWLPWVGSAQTPPDWQPAPLPELSASEPMAAADLLRAQSLLQHAAPAQKVRLLLLLNQPRAALMALEEWRKNQQSLRANANPFTMLPYELLARAILANTGGQQGFRQVFADRIGVLSDQQAHQAGASFTRNPAQNFSRLQELHQQIREAVQRVAAEKSAPAQWTELQLNYFVAYADYYLLSKAWQLAIPLLEADRNRRYHIETDVQIPTAAGVVVSAIVVRSKQRRAPAPVILSASIYADDAAYLQHAIAAAARGYVGVVSFSRGKRSSRAEITPYENETSDVTAVIDWLSRQPWSDGRVAMYGGSYLGYTQWAAVKKLPAALKTIVPAAAAIPGQGLPMENNIFLNANYAWPFFVTNGRYDDPQAYSQYDAVDINTRWYDSGRPYREFDKLAGQPNPWLQKWLRHPAYDEYWQAMVPTVAEYEKLNIPVLSLTGYYDDGQISALQYVKAHQEYNAAAEHYLVIGPYDHLTAQHGTNDPLLRGYRIDQVAHFDPLNLTFSWFDYVLRGKPKPALLKDKINYQLMDDNSWRHAPSLAALQDSAQRFYFAPENEQALYQLTQQAPTTGCDVKPCILAMQQVDLTDRSQSYNQHYYPWPLLQPAFSPTNGLVLQTKPLQQEMTYAGTLTASLRLRLNKKDVDLGLVLFEVKPDGQYFHLGYVLGRASFSSDPTRRNLLTPGVEQIINLQQSRMMAKKIAKGSRLLLLANINLNPHAQINYGTGRDVSDESVKDAGEPLQLEWLMGSFVELPLRPWRPVPSRTTK